ncbi:MAG: hypothetical protein J6W76_05675, partial [Spirochaetales bacterium]|nr:hypothetical protein [Spirochaetales bacterium]
MKKINILFISAIVILLIGCAEEARLEHLNVTLDKDTYYAGEVLDINASFYVTVVDNNGVEKVLGYDALGQSGYAIAGLESAVLDKVGKNDVTLQYFVTSNSNGAFYNYGEVLSKKTSLTVIEPKKSNISSISFTDGTSV